MIIDGVKTIPIFPERTKKPIISFCDCTVVIDFLILTWIRLPSKNSVVVHWCTVLPSPHRVQSSHLEKFRTIPRFLHTIICSCTLVYRPVYYTPKTVQPSSAVHNHPSILHPLSIHNNIVVQYTLVYRVVLSTQSTVQPSWAGADTGGGRQYLSIPPWDSGGGLSTSWDFRIAPQ